MPGHENGEKGKPPACPICGKVSVAKFHPFCGKRCADVDLHRWLNGIYAVPAAEDDSEGAANDDYPEG